jgi:NAD(P)-dependent dehydrogenase (short-subunit alcohol dehydrogenase family)
VFAEEGAAVVCVARREAEGEGVVKSIVDRGGKAVFVAADVAQEPQVEALVRRTLELFGRIDILVNNAGVNFVKPFEELTSADWDRVLGVDLRGTFLCTRACIRTFLKQGSGSVVNIGTVHTLACLPGAAPYDAAKWGMVGLTKSLAVEYASRGIRFNCLSPGLIDTQIWNDIQAGAEDLDACLTHWRANIPMGRVGTIREIAQAAVFLASDEASYITGANLLADGGMTSQLVSKELYRSKSQERE